MNNRYSRQQGFGLIEIMISLVVGLMLTAGVIQIFAANKQTYRVADASARIQENARFATEILGRYLRLAGYRSDPSINPFAKVTYAGYGLAEGQVIAGSDNEIVIRYQSDGSMRDCEDSTPTGAGTNVSMHFSLNSGVLSCDTSLDAGGSQPLVSDVQGMEIHYGIDSDGDRTANRYDRAADVTDWGQVVSVRMTLTLQSAEANTSTTGGNLQHTYTTTIALRNVLP